MEQDQTVLLTGARRPDEMQVTWAKTEVVRAISGKTKINPPDGALLKVVEGKEKGKAFPLGERPQLVIGRSGSDIIINDPKVSKAHCVVEFYENVSVIKDLQSTNGTLLNQFVLAEDFLKPGDRIQIGNTVLEYQAKTK